MTDDDTDPFQRDRWDRPLIPDPVSGKPHPYMRASKFSDLLQEKFLRDWHISWGLVAAVKYPGEAAAIALDQAAGERVGVALQELTDRAGMNEKRDRGTARHTLVRWMLTGHELPDLTRTQKRELTRVADAVRSLGTVTHVEAALVNDDWQCAGSADYIGTCPDGTPFIADLKTGKRYPDSVYAWAIQLVTYAKSRHWRDHQRGEPVAETLPRLYIVHAPQADPDIVDIISIDPGAAKTLADRAYKVACARDGYRQVKPVLQEAPA